MFPNKKQNKFSLPTYCWWILFILMLLACQNGFAANRQPLSDITTEAKNFITQQIQNIDGKIEFSVKPLDRRLKLANCQNNMTSFLPPGSRLEGNTTIGIKCTDPNKFWTVYVSAKILVYKPVVITQSPLERGHLISEADITTRVMETSKLRASYFTKPEQVLGKVTSRRFAMGAPLSSHSVKAPNLVKRGEQVTIIAAINSIRVRMSGKALANGKAGDIIKVRNNNSQRIIEGKVIKAGVVQVRI